VSWAHPYLTQDGARIPSFSKRPEPNLEKLWAWRHGLFPQMGLVILRSIEWGLHNSLVDHHWEVSPDTEARNILLLTDERGKLGSS